MAKEKKNGFVAEFRQFILRGNVVDLAVGVIIGGAFQAIVNSLVNDVIMPVISLLTKGVDFTNLFIQLNGDVKYATLAEAQEAGAAVLAYGNFISAVINFLIMALVIFLLVKGINKVHSIGKKEKPAEEPAPTTKECPFCKSEIAIEATRCPHCTSEIPEAEA
ncbi:MAG: large conductance mechanosensitive channel protein MscL [Oscillospiraceae bacterium]|nr:large conductance mechanosensitive channel protein MscL [Oscillospiraceae bacterium]